MSDDPYDMRANSVYKLREELAFALTERDALRAENARLREALKPFADEASVGPMPGEPHDPRKCSMKFLLAARKALGESDGL